MQVCGFCFGTSFSAIVYMQFCGFGFGEVSLPLGTWDGLRFFIVALPGPSVNYLACPKTKAQISCTVTAQLISTFVFLTYEPCHEKTGSWNF